MIAYLNGILQKKEPVQAIIECGGVGYEVHIPLSTFDKLPEQGKTVQLHIHYAFNEIDGVRLFGFYSSEEKDLFRLLINISKIGPKLALAVLSGLPLSDFIRAVQMSDVNHISTIPGIGKKSAERLIIELKDKVGNLGSKGFLTNIDKGKADLIREAETALITLGYRQADVRKTINKLLQKNEFTTSQEIVKATIKALYQKDFKTTIR